MVEHGYLAEIEIENQVGDQDDRNPDHTVQNLRLEHTFHALTELRKRQAAVT
jgi:hypothetical protein